MNIDYKILWFEDDKDWYDSIQSFIEKYLTDNGFNFIASRYPSGTDLENILSADDFDLILVDYNLPGELGDKLIERLRKFDLYTDIVFYSQNGAEKVRKALQEKAVEGIYCAGRSRDDFEEKVQNVIWTTIKKVQDLNNMRGLVIAKVADLDNDMESIIFKKVNTSDPDSKAKIKNEIKDKLINSLKDRLEVIEKIDVTASFEKLMKKIETYTRWRIVYNFCENQENLNAYKEIVSTFNGEVIDVRNKMAHLKEDVDDEGKKVLKSTKQDDADFVFNDAKCIEIRTNLKKYSKTFSNINDLV